MTDKTKKSNDIHRILPRAKGKDRKLFVSFLSLVIALSILIIALQRSNAVSLCRGFVTTELVSLGGRIGTDNGYAGCRRVERTV